MAWDRRITNTADVRAALERVNGPQRGNLALAPVTTGSEAAPAADVTGSLPCDPQLRPLLPWPGGLRKGATIAAVGYTSLLMLLLAGAMRDTSSWAAVVGMPQLGMLAAIQDHGIPQDRIALVADPGPDWPQIVAALLDGVDLVAVQPPPGVNPRIVGNLAARARQKGAILIPTQPTPGADLTLEVTGRRWHGLREGGGRLKHCELHVQAVGRGRAARPTTAKVMVPGVPPKPTVIPPPAGLPDEQAAVDTALWAHLQPSPRLVDPWAELSR